MDNIRDIAKRIKAIMKDDDQFEARFDRNPAKAIEEVLGIDLPDEKVNKIVTLVRTKLDSDRIEDLLEEGKAKIGKLLD